MWLGTWLISQSQVSKRQTRAILRAPLWERDKQRDLGVKLSYIFLIVEMSDFRGENQNLLDFLMHILWFCMIFYNVELCIEGHNLVSALSLKILIHSCWNVSEELSKTPCAITMPLKRQCFFQLPATRPCLYAPLGLQILPHTSHPLLPNLCHSPVTVAGAPTHWLVLLVTLSMLQYQILLITSL